MMQYQAMVKEDSELLDRQAKIVAEISEVIYNATEQRVSAWLKHLLKYAEANGNDAAIELLRSALALNLKGAEK